MANEPVIRIAIAEDQHLVRSGMIELLQSLGFRVAIDAADGLELLEKIRKAPEPPDVCLLDLSMPRLDGYGALKEIKQHWPEIGVLMYSMFDSEMHIVKGISLGADGYISKNAHPQELCKAIHTVYKGDFYHSENVSRQLVKDVRNNVHKLPRLTDNEEQLLKLACSELTYHEIADEMNISVRTVEGIRDNLFNKLNIHSREGLILFAIESGIVQLKIYPKKVLPKK